MNNNKNKLLLLNFLLAIIYACMPKRVSEPYSRRLLCNIFELTLKLEHFGLDNNRFKVIFHLLWLLLINLLSTRAVFNRLLLQFERSLMFKEMLMSIFLWILYIHFATKHTFWKLFYMISGYYDEKELEICLSFLDPSSYNGLI